MLDRKTPPLFQRNTSYALLTPEIVTLRNGLPLALIHGGGQDVVKLEFIFKAGKWYEDCPGVSYFTAHLLQKGTTTRSSFQIAQELDQFGVHAEVNAGYDFTSIAFYGLTKSIEKLMKLVVEVLTKPTFPPSELAQTKSIYSQGLKVNLEKTSYLASRQLRQNLFGKAHPYGNDATLEQVEALQAEALTAFHHQHFGCYQVICCGNVTDELKKILIDQLTQLSITNTTSANHMIMEATGSHQHVEKKDALQSSIRFGLMIMGRTHADYPAFLLLNHIFGGYFGSRLMKNIREDKGLTYGIYSSITGLKNASYVTIGADVNVENREIAIQEIKNEMEKLREEMISTEEFETARNHFIGSLQTELSTPFAHAEKIKNIILHSLSKDFYQQLVNTIDVITPGDLQQMADRYLNDKNFTIVTAG